MNQQNQNLPAEYIPVVKMIQKEESIRKGINSLKEKILVSAGEEFLSWEEEKRDKFLERTIITIAKDEKLIPCFQSAEGKLSIVEAVEKAVSTGLQIGGKHAYLVPQPRKSNRKNEKGQDIWVSEVRFSIRDRGYYALLCGGKKPIFLDLRWSTVYEKDECSVDSGTGIINHKKFIGERGKFLGCWVQAKKINGQLEAEFYPVSKIDQWRNCSKAYQLAAKQNYNDSPWIQWPEEMALQASIRHFCERYEEARELLSSALYDDEQEVKEEKTSVEKIDDALDGQVDIDDDFRDDSLPENPEEKQEEKPENSKKKQEKKELDLF